MSSRLLAFVDKADDEPASERRELERELTTHAAELRRIEAY